MTPGTTRSSEVGLRSDGVCPRFHAAVELIGKRWSGAIVCALLDGPMRFAELSCAVPGVSDRLLSQRLKELEQEGIVERTVIPGVPVRVQYNLTSKGASLRPAIEGLREWARSWSNPPSD